MLFRQLVELIQENRATARFFWDAARLTGINLIIFGYPLSCPRASVLTRAVNQKVLLTPLLGLMSTAA